MTLQSLLLTLANSVRTFPRKVVALVQWCTASTITAASQMEDIKKWHEAIKRSEDKRTGEEDQSE
jgi:hypothetical protein